MCQNEYLWSTGLTSNSNLHNFLSKPPAAFPHNHCGNRWQWWERNESCSNDYHQSFSPIILAQPVIEQEIYCSKVLYATDWAKGLDDSPTVARILQYSVTRMLYDCWACWHPIPRHFNIFVKTLSIIPFDFTILSMEVILEQMSFNPKTFLLQWQVCVNFSNERLMFRHKFQPSIFR